MQERERDEAFSAWEKPSGPLRAGPSVRRDCRAWRRPSRGERASGAPAPAPASNAMMDRKRHWGRDEKPERTADDEKKKKKKRRRDPPGGSSKNPTS